MRPTGKVNLVGVVMAAGVIYGAWWAITYVPAHLDNLDVKEGTVAAFNSLKTENEHQVRGTLLVKCNAKTLGWHREEDESGNMVVKPGLGIKPEQIVITRDEVNNLLTVSVEYDREIELKPFDKVEFKHFLVQQTGPMR